jgi:hypothetical protein
VGDGEAGPEVLEDELAVRLPDVVGHVEIERDRNELAFSTQVEGCFLIVVRDASWINVRGASRDQSERLWGEGACFQTSSGVYMIECCTHNERREASRTILKGWRAALHNAPCEASSPL